MLKFIKILGGAVVLSGVIMSSSAAGNADKLAKAACYASIQKKCHGGQTDCSPAEYAEGIAWCDANFTDISSKGASTKVLSATKLMLNFLTPN